MNHRPVPGKILSINMGAHAITYLAFSFQLCGLRDLDLTCSTTFLFSDATCLQVGPMSLDWLVNPFGRFDLSRSSLPLVLSGEQHRGAFRASIHSRWRQGALHTQPQILQRTTGWDGCGPFLSEGLRCITWNTRGLVGSVLQTNEQRIQNQFSQKTLGQKQYFLQEVHGKDEFLQAIQVLVPHFQFSGIFLPDNENVEGSAICIHEDVSHVNTCQGRDHLLNIRSGPHNPRFCQRPFLTWTYFEAVTWKIASCSPALACISLWCGRYFRWFQLLWSGRRTI